MRHSLQVLQRFSIDSCAKGRFPTEELDAADREGTFEPQLIPTHERRFTGFDGKSWRSTRAG